MHQVLVNLATVLPTVRSYSALSPLLSAELTGG